MKSAKKAFTIRVYGILINEFQQVLIAEEMYKNRYMVKFPGGGLAWGEGTSACLVREFKEELDLDIVVGNHFYTTDFFVASAFNPDVQLLSIYYRVSAPPGFRPPDQVLDRNKSAAEVFRFVPLAELANDSFFSFPVDQYVGKLLFQNTVIRQ